MFCIHEAHRFMFQGPSYIMAGLLYVKARLPNGYLNTLISIAFKRVEGAASKRLGPVGFWAQK
jgi:hypothetical protein